MTGIMCSFVGGQAGTAYLDTQYVTVGTYYDFFSGILTRGFSSSLLTGSISTGFFAPKGGAAISGLYIDTTGFLYFALANSPLTNSGWSNMALGAQNFTRASATFYSTGGATVWYWTYSVDPFGADGTVTTAVFT